MSIQRAYLVSDISTTTAFRAVVEAHRAMLAAIGLVRVPFAGEINPSTVAAPTTSNTIKGYEIWRFDDALQATAPVYLKVGYGCASSTSNFRLSLSVGTGTNGAGALTGAVTPALVMSMGSYNADVYATYVSGDSGRLLLRFWPELTPASMNLISVERLPSATGQPSGDGIVAWQSFDQYFNEAHSIRADGRVDSYTSAPCLISTTHPGSSGAVDADVPLYPVRAWMGRRETRPLHSLLAYLGADIAAGNLVSVTCWDGVVRRYLPLGINSYSSYGLAGGATYQCAAIRWE